MSANELQEIMMEEKIDELKRVSQALMDSHTQNDEIQE